MKKGKYPELFIVAAACMWGCMGLLVRPLDEIGLTSMEIVALRAWVTLCVMSAGILIFDRPAFLINGKDIWIFAGNGILSVVFFNFCYFTTITLTSLSVAAVLLYTAPFFVILLSSLFFREKITARKIFSMVMAFFGCMMVTGVWDAGTSLSGRGIIFGLCSGLGYALYSIFGKAAVKREYSSVTVTLYTFLASSLGVLVFVNPIHILYVLAQHPDSILKTFLLILITTVFPYLAYTAGLSKTQPGKAAVIACVEPVMATVVGFLVYQERPRLMTTAGIVLVLTGVILVNFTGKGEK